MPSSVCQTQPEHICTCSVHGNDDRSNDTCRVFSDFEQTLWCTSPCPPARVGAKGTAHSGLNIHKLRLLWLDCLFGAMIAWRTSSDVIAVSGEDAQRADTWTGKTERLIKCGLLRIRYIKYQLQTEEAHSCWRRHSGVHAPPGHWHVCVLSSKNHKISAERIRRLN